MKMSVPSDHSLTTVTRAQQADQSYTAQHVENSGITGVVSALDTACVTLAGNLTTSSTSLA